MDGLELLTTSTCEIDLETQLAAILRDAINVVRGDAGVVALWREKEGCFSEATINGLALEDVENLRPLLKKGIPDLAASKPRYGLLSQLAPETHLVTKTMQKVQIPIIALQLVIGEDVVGLMYVLRLYSQKPFRLNDQRLLSPFTGQMSIAVKNAFLEQQLAILRFAVESIRESSADGIVIINADRRIVSVNTGMEKLTGWSREDLVNSYCYDVLGGVAGKGECIRQTMCPLSTGPEGLSNIDGEITTKDGEEVEVSMAYSIMRSAIGIPPMAVVTVRDIGRLHKIENMELSLLATVSHQLQTPISIIKAYASTLARADVRWTKKTVADKLRVIEEESDRLSELVNKLLHASQLETKFFSLNKLSLSLPKEAHRVANKFSGLTEIHKFVVDFPTEFPAVRVDPMRIGEVLINLVDNAVKFSPQGGTITISGKMLDDGVSVTVTDEGLGIPKRAQEHIFDRFYKVGSALPKPFEGTGLGLHICQAIVEAHGGQIKVESQLGKGSSFTFILPLGQDLD